MRHLKTTLLISVTLSLAACGSIMTGQTQEVQILTPGAYESKCTLDNGVRYVAYNGDKITVQRSRNALEIDCYGSGNRHLTKTVEASFNDWSAANVSNGAAPGGTYDLFSGGLWEYPAVIEIDFVGVPTRGYELPDYHNKDNPNPYKQMIEDYGPTTPRINNDSAYMRRGVTKRDGDGRGTNPFAAPPKTDAAPKPAASAPRAEESGLRSGMTQMPVLKGGNADELTRSANPTVFRK